MKKRFILLASLSLLLSACGSSSNSELTIVHFDQTILGESQKELGVSIGVKIGNEELKENINSSLAKLDNETRTTWMNEAVLRSNSDTSASTILFNKNPSYDDSSKEDLVIGLECNYAPFNWTEVKENEFTYRIEGKTNEFAEGYDVQVAKFIANDLNMNLKIVKMEWDSLVPSLQNDTINAIIAGMTDTEERRKSIDFTDEYYRSELVLITRKGSEFDTNGEIADLSIYKGAKFVSQVETVTDSIIDSWVTSYGVRHLSPMETFADCAIAVKQGTADIMTAELPVANSIVNSSK